MKTLFVHVGYHKTGSSYIQSSLALSARSLSNYDIEYPTDASQAYAAAGGISSGNGMRLFDSSNSTQFQSTRSVLLSSELLFSALLSSPPDYLNTVCQQINAKRLKVLLYIRNPIEHAASFFQQEVKRGGFSGTIDEMFATYSHPLEVRDFIGLVESIPQAELTLINYSSTRSTLLEGIASWLEVPRTALKEPSSSIVNRSMTYAELEFQRSLNSMVGASGRLLSDPLCEALPNIQADAVLPPAAIQALMLERLREPLEFIDEALPICQKQDFSLLEPKSSIDPTRLEFSKAQLHIIAESLGAEIERLRNHPFWRIVRTTRTIARKSIGAFSSLRSKAFRL